MRLSLSFSLKISHLKKLFESLMSFCFLIFSFFKKNYLFIYLFLVVSGLSCDTWDFSLWHMGSLLWRAGLVTPWHVGS